MKIVQAWCPTCRERTVLDAGKPCAWCGTRLVERDPGSGSRISDAQARVIYAKYQQGWSARKLGRLLFRTLGYASPASCANAIGETFLRLGLPVRGRMKAVVLASTVHGLSPRDKREQRRRRRQAGLNTDTAQPLQPACVGVNERHPRKGLPCAKPARVGSVYCHSHAGQE